MTTNGLKEFRKNDFARRVANAIAGAEDGSKTHDVHFRCAAKLLLSSEVTFEHDARCGQRASGLCTCGLEQAKKDATYVGIALF